MSASSRLSPPYSKVVSALSQAFEAHGKQLYLVGGSVRDMLLSRLSPDLDFTTDARPPEVKRLARRAGATVYDVGERFGTIGAFFGDSGGTEVVRAEITTFRSERYSTYSRKPDVSFGDSLEGDLARRDFTVNAMALDARQPDSPVIDPHDGQGDLARRLVRAVGLPNQRFSEDPLRLLRAVRLATVLDFRIEPETEIAIRQQASELAWIPKERLQPELSHILLADQAARGVRQLCELGLMEQLVPELLTLRGMHEDTFRHKDVFEHTLQVVENLEPDETLRWAALLHDIAKPCTRSVIDGEVHFHRHELVGRTMARKILARLKYPRQLVDDVARLVELHLRPNSYEPDWTDGAVRRLIREAGDSLDQLLLLSSADVTTRRAEKRRAADRRVEELRWRCEALQAQADVAKLTSPLDGNELMDLFGRGPGPWIKPIKDHLTELVVEGELVPDDKERAAEIARKLASDES